MPTGSFVLITILSTMNLYHINGESNSCSSYQEHSPLCFCRSFYRQASLTDIFMSKISLSQCSKTSSTTQCRQGRLSPSSTHVTQLVPNLVNYSHCLENTRCLYTLYNTQRCHRCHIRPSSLSSENTSYVISTETNNLPGDSCFYICENDKSCGFLCFDQRITITIDCNTCRGRRRNVTCRCIRLKQSESCVHSTEETTTPRWMQKRGFPAAGILALLVLVTILIIIAMKLISQQIGRLNRRRSRTTCRSITTITTYRSRQPSPSTALVSFPNTPLTSRVQLRRDHVTANTMVELLNDKPREYVVDIHHRTEETDELGVFILKNPAQVNPKSQEILHIDDDTEEKDTT